MTDTIHSSRLSPGDRIQVFGKWMTLSGNSAGIFCVVTITKFFIFPVTRCVCIWDIAKAKIDGKIFDVVHSEKHLDIKKVLD